MRQILFTADDYGKFAEGDKVILNSGVNRLSVMMHRQKSFDIQSLEHKIVGLHADFGGENLQDFISLILHPKRVRQQLDQQIEDFTTLFGKAPAYIDSHRFFHFFPTVFPIFLAACKAHNISYLRISRKGVAKINSLKTAVIHAMILLNNLLYHKQIADFVHVDYFLSLDWYTTLDFPLPDGVIKVIFHPENSMELLHQLQHMQQEKPL